MPKQLFSVAVGMVWYGMVWYGMVLADETVYKQSKEEALIKFEQGYKQKKFLYLLFDFFKNYRFMESPGVRLHKEDALISTPKSYWFKTLSHPTFTEIYNIFYSKNSQEKKVIFPRSIINFVDDTALAF